MLSAPVNKSLREVAKTLIRPMLSPAVATTPMSVVGFMKLATGTLTEVPRSTFDESYTCMVAVPAFPVAAKSKTSGVKLTALVVASAKIMSKLALGALVLT